MLLCQELGIFLVDGLEEIKIRIQDLEYSYLTHITNNRNGSETKILKNQSQKKRCTTMLSVYQYRWCTSSHSSESVYKVAILCKKHGIDEHGQRKHE